MKNNVEHNSKTLQQFAEVLHFIRNKQQDVYRVANVALIDLYWNIGAFISQRVKSSEWGEGIVNQLAEYLDANLPDSKGFSNKNLWRMKQFYETYAPIEDSVSTLLRQISWSNNLMIMSRVKNPAERIFYLNLSVNERLSFRQLERQINAAVYERSNVSRPKLSTVLRETVPQAQSVFRDQYVMEFIGGKTYPHENNLKRALITHMKEFLLELGKDFIFMSEEYRLQVGNSDFRIDLLFYHRELQCLVAFELKTEAFKPEHLGQLNFYLEALDRDVKKTKENPSIGVLLCTDKDNEVVEYALSRSLSPTMVAEYQLCLPDKQRLQQKMKEIVVATAQDEQTDLL